MFGRATITLGIGPHSSCDLRWLFILRVVVAKRDQPVIICRVSM